MVTVTVRRSGGRTSAGDVVPSAEHQLGGCVYDPGGSSEITSQGNSIQTKPSLLFDDPGADVTGADQVLLPGDLVPWTVEGDPLRYINPFDPGQSGCRVELARSTGG